MPKSSSKDEHVQELFHRTGGRNETLFAMHHAAEALVHVKVLAELSGQCC